MDTPPIPKVFWSIQMDVVAGTVMTGSFCNSSRIVSVTKSVHGATEFTSSVRITNPVS